MSTVHHRALPGLAVLLVSTSAAAAPGRHLLLDPLSRAVLTQAHARPSDPGSKGPYEVGFTSFIAVDGSRSSDGALLYLPDGPKYPGRPVRILVWYPADPTSVSGMPEAVYPLDPVYGRAHATSSMFEKYGFDGAYQEPPVSSAAPFPLLIFSPGANGNPLSHAWLGARLASHGFVVAVPYHWGDRYFLGGEPLYVPAVAAVHRPRDLSFALTTLLAHGGSPDDLLHGAVRPDQVAAAGWSLGGYAAIVLAAGDDVVCDVLVGAPASTCIESPADPRFRAIVTFDAVGHALHWSELARARVPSLVMGREWSILAALVAAGQDNALLTSVARPHGAFGGHPNIRVDVSNTNHQSFSGFCELNEVLHDLGILPDPEYLRRKTNTCTGIAAPTEVHRLLAQYVIAFLRTALAGDPGLDYYLTPGWALTRESLAEVFVTEKRNPNAAEDECLIGASGCPDPQLFLYFPHQPGSEQARAEKDPAPAGFTEADEGI